MNVRLEDENEGSQVYARWVPLLFCLIAFFPVFIHLGSLPLRVWDESRQAISALEMSEHGNWLVAHFYGAPDMWSTKPPLLIWIQALFFQLLGPGELALRLPSAIAAFLTGWALLRVSSRVLGAPWLGLIACIMLYTSDGYIDMHAARSGDYDAPLALWMTLAAWSLFRWSVDANGRHVLFLFIFLTCGVMTKSIQGLLFVPGMAIYLLARRQLVPMLRERMFFVGAALFLLVVGGFYLAREAVNPGYLQS